MAKIAEEKPAKKDMFTCLKEAAVKEFGSKAITEVDTLPFRLPTGITTLDHAIHSDGKGLPGGRVIEIYGEYGVIKSGLALAICRSAQARGGYAIYLEPECALVADTVTLARVNRSAGWIYRQPTTAEQCLQAITAFMEILRARRDDDTRPVVIVVDSVAALVPQSHLKKDWDETPQMAALARLLSRFFPEGIQFLTGTNCYLIFINQVRSNFKQVGYNVDPHCTVGGAALGFYTSIRIKLKRKSLLKYKEGHPRHGQERGLLLTATVDKSKIGPSRRTAEFPFYTHSAEPYLGVNDGDACFEYLKGRDIIKWYTPAYRLGDLRFSQEEFIRGMAEDANFASGIRGIVHACWQEQWGDSYGEDLNRGQ